MARPSIFPSRLRLGRHQRLPGTPHRPSPLMILLPPPVCKAFLAKLFSPEPLVTFYKLFFIPERKIQWLIAGIFFLFFKTIGIDCHVGGGEEQAIVLGGWCFLLLPSLDWGPCGIDVCTLSLFSYFLSFQHLVLWTSNMPFMLLISYRRLLYFVPHQSCVFLLSDFSLSSLLYFDQCGHVGLGFIGSFSSSWQWPLGPGSSCRSWALPQAPEASFSWPGLDRAQLVICPGTFQRSCSET